MLCEEISSTHHQSFNLKNWSITLGNKLLDYAFPPSNLSGKMNFQILHTRLEFLKDSSDQKT